MSGKWAIGLVSLMLTAPAAAETSKNFQVSAVIANGCVISGGSGSWGTISFGTVNGAVTSNPEADLIGPAATGLALDCTPGMTANVTAGPGNQATAGVRRLRHSTLLNSHISYDLLVGSGQTLWTTQSVPLIFSAGTSRMVLPIRARAHLTAPTAAGDYTDTVNITISW